MYRTNQKRPGYKIVTARKTAKSVYRLLPCPIVGIVISDKGCRPGSIWDRSRSTGPARPLPLGPNRTGGPALS